MVEANTAVGCRNRLENDSEESKEKKGNGRVGGSSYGLKYQEPKVQSLTFALWEQAKRTDQ
jgi:hypothetical protein